MTKEFEIIGFHIHTKETKKESVVIFPFFSFFNGDDL